MRNIVLFCLFAVAASPAFAHPGQKDLVSTVAIEWVDDKPLERHPQEVNWARRKCDDWASNITNAHERQQLYVRCLRAELPATHYRIIDMTDPRAVQGRYPPANNRSMLEFPHEGQ